MMRKKITLFFIVILVLVSCTPNRNIDYVNPFIGTGGHGHTYPGPSMPFGMMQLGPDTRLTGWDGCSGYHYTDSVIYGFSHTHLNGTGISDYADILFMPTTGEIQFNKGDEKNTSAGYCSSFMKSNEQASPGYYSVLLDDYDILTELTVAERSGYHKYTFPQSEESHIIIDLEHRDPVIALFTLIEPERTLDIIETFLKQYDQGGLLPVWELSANETMTMIGYHSVPVIVDAYIKGIRDFDVEKAYEAMKHSAELDHHGLKAYREYGYIPVSEESESVSKALEYAYDDWCIAQMAKELGKEEDYEYFLKRAQSYKNIFDPSTGFMRGRINGGWFTPFDPREVNFNYTEANSWQYSFFVPQDVSGLMDLMGGREPFVNKLDQLFAESIETTGRNQADITGLIGQYAHGNEPSHHMAYLYAFAGLPHRTQEIVSQIMKQLYTANPGGLSGNEDAGQMSAWYVLSALGFYSVTPGLDYYVFSTPAFKKAEINLPGGNRFRIIAKNLTAENIYIHSATLNGENYTKSFIRHNDIVSGGELVLEMGNIPGTGWGTGMDDIPGTSIRDHLIQPVPHLTRGERTFIDSTVTALGSIKEVDIYYTLDGSDPNLASARYQSPICIDHTTVLKAFSHKEGEPESPIITAEFRKIPPGRTIALLSTYSPQYSAGGDMALIDYIRGPENFRTGAWQGYEGQNLEAVVDLGGLQEIHSLSAGFLQDPGSWIFMPEYVEFSISNDGKTFIPVGRVNNNISQRDNDIVIKEFKINVYPKQVRYIKVFAKSVIDCPEWHKGAGGKAWLFVDEIMIQ